MPTKVYPGEMIISIKVKKSFHAEVKKAAAANQRSMQGYVQVAIQEKMQRDSMRASNTAWMPPGVGIMNPR